MFLLPHGAEEQESFNYVALGHNVEILGRVLMNIANYVGLEQEQRVETPFALRESCKTSRVLEISELVEKLGNRIGEQSLYAQLAYNGDQLTNYDFFSIVIVDTRAAHPDRSNTKAAIQRLTMRLHYQYSDAVAVLSKRAAMPKGKKLDAFFRRSSPTGGAS